MESIKKHAIKIQVGTVVAVSIFIISTVWFIAGKEKDHALTVSHIESEAHRGIELAELNRNRITLLEAKNIDQDLVIVEIRTKLANIETLLQELKEDFKSVTK